jgi:hypothetical protein
MGRMALAGTTLVSAIPAGFVCYLFYTFLTQYSGNARGGLQALAWGTLLVAVGPLLLPIVAFVTAGPQSSARPKSKGAEPAADESIAEGEVLEESGEFGEAEEIGSGDLATLDDSSEFDSGAEFDSSDDVESASSGEFEVFEEDDDKK